MKTSDNIKQAVPFLWVSDIDKSLQFYVKGLGFEMTNQWIPDDHIEWCWLQMGGVALMLQEIRKDRREEWLAAGKPGHGVSICFICNDALAFYHDVLSRGIPAERPFVGNGSWVVGMNDPDGYRLEFESETTAEEGTEYAE